MFLQTPLFFLKKKSRLLKLLSIYSIEVDILWLATFVVHSSITNEGSRKVMGEKMTDKRWWTADKRSDERLKLIGQQVKPLAERNHIEGKFKPLTSLHTYRYQVQFFYIYSFQPMIKWKNLSRWLKKMDWYRHNGYGCTALLMASSLLENFMIGSNHVKIESKLSL